MALSECRRRAIDALTDPGVPSTMLPFLAHAVDDTVRTFGDDWWPYGLQQNRAALQTLARYACEQQLTPGIVNPDDCFLNLNQDSQCQPYQHD